MGDEWLLFLAGLFFLGLAYVVGRASDPIWRGKKMRQFMRKDYILVNIVGKDRKSISSVIADSNSGILKVGKFLWVLEAGRIYRKDKPQAGFMLGPSVVRHEEGMPTVYVDSESLKPLDFFQEAGAIKPDEVSGSLVGFIANEMAKALMSMKGQQMLTYVIIAVVLVSALLGWLGYSEAHDAKMYAWKAYNNTIVIGDHFGLNLNPADNQTAPATQNQTQVIRTG